MTGDLRAPFPWFGGKRRVAEVVWRAFGDPPNYVEPFCGSLAVLLGRPTPAKIETVNDKDCYLANFWRAVKSEPFWVAQHADWPVSEADLHARHRWLVGEWPRLRGRIVADPDFYDTKVAGWWVWGLSMWIGGGWCKAGREDWVQRPDLQGHGDGIHAKKPDLYPRGFGRGVVENGRRPQLHGTNGLHVKRPQCDARNAGQGVHKRPSLNTGGQGAVARLVGERRPSLGVGGGVRSERIPNLGSERGVLGADAPPCEAWFTALAERLRRVRVCCGDWTRVLTDSVIGTTKSRNSGMNPCAVFLDPPYSGDERDPDLYVEDDARISQAVRAWAIEKGDDPDLRIALCGYEGEHAMPRSWTEYAWTGVRGYSSETNENRRRERIWFSPACLPLDPKQRHLDDLLPPEEART